MAVGDVISKLLEQLPKHVLITLLFSLMASFIYSYLYIGFELYYVIGLAIIIFFCALFGLGAVEIIKLETGYHSKLPTHSTTQLFAKTRSYPMFGVNWFFDYVAGEYTGIRGPLCPECNNRLEWRMRKIITNEWKCYQCKKTFVRPDRRSDDELGNAVYESYVNAKSTAKDNYGASSK